MKLLLDVNLTKTKTHIKLHFWFGEFWLCLTLSYFHILPFTDLFANTHLQRARIDTRDSSRMSRETCTIDENVLEQRSQSTSCILSLNLSIFSNCVCFDLWNLHTHTHIEEKWKSLLFSVFYSCVPWFETHTKTHINWKNFETICEMLQQQWNEMKWIHPSTHPLTHQLFVLLRKNITDFLSHSLSIKNCRLSFISDSYHFHSTEK
jgi:hypothetical protein